MSQTVLLVTIIVVCIIVVATILKWTSKKTVPALSYEKNFSLLSAAEKAFITTLEPLLGERYRVSIKPRLADLIAIKPVPGQIIPPDTEAKINATTVSFVLCYATDFSIAGIIHLENRSNPVDFKVMSDQFIENGAREAGLPIIQVPSRLQYDPEELAEILAENIELPQQTESTSAQNKYGDCPSCGEPLMLLKAKQGENIGKYFLGCSNYPECKYLSILNDSENIFDLTAQQTHAETTIPAAEKQK